MGLFNSKVCDICGQKIKLLSNKKLKDGNLCKECANKLSPFFKERKESTINNSKESLFDKKEFSYLELNLIKLGIIIVDLAIIIYSFYFWIIKKRTNKVLNILHSTPRR